MRNLTTEEIENVSGGFITTMEDDLWIPSQLSGVTTIAALEGTTGTKVPLPGRLWNRN